MRVLVHNPDSIILIVDPPSDVPPFGVDTKFADIADTEAAKIGNLGDGVYTLRSDNTIAFVPTAPTPPPPPAPNINGLIKALVNSPSIDQATKNALITALQGG